MIDYRLEYLLQCIEPFIEFIEDFDTDKNVPDWYEIAHSRKGWGEFTKEKTITVYDLRELYGALKRYRSKYK